MRRRLSLVLVMCVVLPACSRTAPNSTVPMTSGKSVASTTPAAGMAAAGIEDLEIGTPIQHRNLTVFPIFSKSDRNEDRFLTLDEGLQAGTVEVYELGAAAADSNSASADLSVGGIQAPVDDSQPVPSTSESPVVQQIQIGDVAGNEVNRVVVINKSDKPLYLMPGEVLVGGSQDRTIAEETIIAATGKPVPVDVYCVEHGRWGGRNVDQSVALYSAFAPETDRAASLAREANTGKFVAQAGHLNKSGRLAATAGEGQQKVWDEVARVNAESQIAPDSGAFTANFADQSVLDRLAPYQQALQAVSDQDRIVGVIVAINGKPESTDVFESTPLFRKFWPKLLKGYSLDASHTADAEESQSACQLADAEAFLTSVLAGQAQGTQTTEGGLVVSRRENEHSVSFSAGHVAPVDAAAGAMGGGGFGAVHASGFSK